MKKLILLLLGVYCSWLLNGQVETIRVEADKVLIQNNAKLGIGTTNPTSRLHINANLSESALRINRGLATEVYITPEGEIIIGDETNSLDSKVVLEADAGENPFRVRIDGGTKFKLNSNGGITNSNTIPEYAIHLQNSSTSLLGRALANGWYTYSDRRIKSNIKTLEYGLSEILSLQPKSYDHHHSEYFENGEVIRKGNQTTKAIGLIAQDTYSIIPEAVSKPIKADDLWTMDYTRLVPVLINAVQEQQDMINSIEIQVNQQQVQLEALTKLVLESNINKTKEED